MPNLRIILDAQQDLDDATRYLKWIKRALARSFVAEVRRIFLAIGQQPRMHAKVFGNVRMAVVPKTKYVVYYYEEAGEVVVASVFHSSRDPAVWQSRIDLSTGDEEE